jgi:hypothetical protein
MTCEGTSERCHYVAPGLCLLPKHLHLIHQLLRQLVGLHGCYVVVESPFWGDTVTAKFFPALGTDGVPQIETINIFTIYLFSIYQTILRETCQLEYRRTVHLPPVAHVQCQNGQACACANQSFHPCRNTPGSHVQPDLYCGPCRCSALQIGLPHQVPDDRQVCFLTFGLK